MRALLYSGLLYLLGISVILVIKPSFMFTEDGGWKEFGIGRDSNTYTWFPFWLFTILWALVSFFLVQILATMSFLPGVEWTPIDSVVSTTKVSGSRRGPPELKPGYYMLNTEGTTAEGVPKYIYIGSAPVESTTQ